MSKDKPKEKAKEEIKSFSEVYRSDWGTAGNLSELRGKEVIIRSVDFVEAALGEAAIVYLEVDGETKKYHTFSKVVIKQLKAIADKLPVRATVKKIKNYYTLA